MEMPSYESIVQRMQEEFEKQAGFVPDDASDIGIRMKVLAGELFSCYASLDWLWRQTFPQTAQGDCLDLRAAERGLQRKQPLSAKGSLVFRVPPRWRTIWPSLWGRSALWRGRMVPNSSPYRKRY